MREIKFRAWDKESGQMFYSDDGRGFYFELSPIGGNGLRDIKGNDLKGNFSDWMQYTGLKDKNGVEIYEGDITSSGWQIMFDDGIFCPFYDFGRQERYEDVGTNWWWNCEIIGNIYQNPQLLTN